MGLVCPGTLSPFTGFIWGLALTAILLTNVQVVIPPLWLWTWPTHEIGYTHVTAPFVAIWCTYFARIKQYSRIRKCGAVPRVKPIRGKFPIHRREAASMPHKGRGSVVREDSSKSSCLANAGSPKQPLHSRPIQTNPHKQRGWTCSGSREVIPSVNSFQCVSNACDAQQRVIHLDLALQQGSVSSNQKHTDHEGDPSNRPRRKARGLAAAFK